MIKFSFIVPVYNAEKYLDRCIKSMLKQSLQNFEIILIDDASTDNSIGIMKKYQERNSNISIYRNEKNKGVSYSRNIGIKKAQGEYLVFCDADDWYEENALEQFSNAIEKYNADFVTSNYYISYDNAKIKISSENQFAKENITKEECIAYMTTTSSAKAINRNLFLNNNIYYPVGTKRNEELSVIPIVSYKSKKPVYIDEFLYNYYQNKKSASNKKIQDFSFYDATFQSFVKNIENTEEYQQEIEFRAIEQLLYNKLLVMIKSKISRIDILKEIDDFKKNYPNFLKNKYLKNYRKSKIVFIKILNNKMLFLAKIFTILHEIITG